MCATLVYIANIKQSNRMSELDFVLLHQILHCSQSAPTLLQIITIVEVITFVVNNVFRFSYSRITISEKSHN